jgi:hypothetical protein
MLFRMVTKIEDEKIKIKIKLKRTNLRSLQNFIARGVTKF